MELRILGIKMYMPGTAILQKLLRGEVKTEQLSENEIDLVLEAWDTRNFVPGNLAYPHEVDRVKPIITNLRGEVKTEQLSENEIDLVLEAWDTRNFVPGNLAYPHEVDRVKPIITKKEVIDGVYTEEDYKRNYVEQIEKYLKITVF